MTRFDEATRVLARRLYDGNVDRSDLGSLFLTLRQARHVLPAVREIGDFIAHGDNRDEGLMVTRVGALFAVLKYLFSRENYFYAWESPHFAEAITANCILLDEGIIREELGISRLTTQQRVRKVLNKFTQPVAGGPWHLQGVLGDNEMKLISFLTTRTQSTTSSLSQAGLANHFEQSLVSNGIFSAADAKMTMDVSNRLALFALSKMHGTILTLPDGHAAVAYIASSNGMMCVQVNVELAGKPPAFMVAQSPKSHLPPLSTTTTVVVPIFATQLDPAVNCEGQMAGRIAASGKVDIDSLVEMKSTGRLDFLHPVWHGRSQPVFVLNRSDQADLDTAIVLISEDGPWTMASPPSPNGPELATYVCGNCAQDLIRRAPLLPSKMWQHTNQILISCWHCHAYVEIPSIKGRPSMAPGVYGLKGDKIPFEPISGLESLEPLPPPRS